MTNQTAYDELTAVSVTGYTVTSTDPFGRVTNSVRIAYVGDTLANDPAPPGLATRTEYPYGTDGYSVTTDTLGVQTVTRTYYEGNARISETASAGVTNRVTETFGGATVSEMFWDGKWTRETRATSYDVSVRRIPSTHFATAGASCPVIPFTEHDASTVVKLVDGVHRTLTQSRPLGQRW